MDTKRLFSIGKVSPAASLAIKEVKKRHLLPPHTKLSIKYYDSKCSESDGMNEAIHSYIHYRANVFFGPVCDFAAAPVARQTTYWDLPMVSVGAMARDFYTRRRTVYPLLTRAGPANLQALAQSFVALFRKKYQWTKFKVLYEQLAHSDIVIQFCHLASDALVNGIPQKEIHLDYFRLELEEQDLERILKEEVGNAYGGKNI